MILYSLYIIESPSTDIPSTFTSYSKHQMKSMQWGWEECLFRFLISPDSLIQNWSLSAYQRFRYECEEHKDQQLVFWCIALPQHSGAKTHWRANQKAIHFSPLVYFYNLWKITAMNGNVLSRLARMRHSKCHFKVIGHICTWALCNLTCQSMAACNWTHCWIPREAESLWYDSVCVTAVVALKYLQVKHCICHTARQKQNRSDGPNIYRVFWGSSCLNIYNKQQDSNANSAQMHINLFVCLSVWLIV